MGKVQEHKRAAKARRQDDNGGGGRKVDPDQIEIEGIVLECLPNTMFRVQITVSPVPQMIDRVLLGTLAGKMRLYRIRVLPGDGVKGYISKYDLDKCKITYRSAKKVTQSI